MVAKTRRKNPDVEIERLSPNRTKPRISVISRNTPHCVAGNLTVETTLGLQRVMTFDPVNGMSMGYAIGTDGRAGLGCEETNRTWTTSSFINDHRSITYEIANNGPAPDWRMSDAAINKWLEMSVEQALFYGFKKVNWRPKPENIGVKTITAANRAQNEAAVEAWIATWAKDDEMIITLHCWYANKVCPGPYFIRQLPWLVREMNKRLQDPKRVPEAFVGEGATPPSTIPKEPTTSVTPTPTPTFKEYQITITASALNVRSSPDSTKSNVVRTLINDKNTYTIIEEADGPGAKRWGRLKSGIGWISLDFTTKK